MTLPQITATGNLGGHPELKFTKSGKAVVSLSVGCNDTKKGADGSFETLGTTWLRVQLWDGEAEVAAEHLKKGDSVTVTGLLTVREFEKTDGTKGQSVEVKWPRVSKALPKPGGSPGPVQAADPWGAGATPTAPSGGASWGGQQPSDEPPF